VEAALEEVKKAMAEGGLEKITAATDKLTTASHKLAEAMYKAGAPANGTPGAQGTPGAGPTPEQEKPKDNVVDAEFVDVEDKK